MSSSRIRRKALSSEISRTGIEMAPCTDCRNAKPKRGERKPPCIVGARSGRCSECVRKGYQKCDVTVSRLEWERLRDSRDQMRIDLEKAEEREAELMQQLLTHRARTIRLRKQLRQAERRTERAVAEELDDIEEAERVEASVLFDSEPGVVAEERSFFHDIIEMPPEDWASLDGLLDFPLEVPSSQPEAVL